MSSQQRSRAPRSARALARRLPTVLAVSFLAVNGAASAQTPPEDPDGPPPAWQLDAGASFVSTSGNSQTMSAGVETAFIRRWPRWTLETTAAVVRASERETTTAERYQAEATGQRPLTDQFAVELGWRGERDRFAGFNLRSTTFLGLNWEVPRDDDWEIDVLAAASWEHERLLGGATGNLSGAVLRVTSLVPLSPTAQTSQLLRYSPSLTGAAEYRLEALVDLQAAVNDRLAVKLAYETRFDNEPVVGFRRTDTTATASLVLSLRE